MPIKGKYIFSLKIQGETVEHPFYVIPTLNEKAILGMDFIRQHQLAFCPISADFTWANKKGKTQWSSGQMRTTRKERLEGLSEKTIKVQTLTSQGQQPEPGDYSYGTIMVDQRPSLMGGPGFIKIHPGGHAYINIINSSPNEVELPRDLVVGILDNPNECFVKELDPELINSIAESKIKSVPKISAEKEKFIKENLVLQVPDSEKAEYKKLILENHDVFSFGKHDLGKATTLMHDIELRSEEPIFVKQFKIPEAHFHEIEKNVTEWLKLGVVQPTRSKFNSPLFLVGKKDGGLRVVQDFRACLLYTSPSPRD